MSATTVDPSAAVKVAAEEAVTGQPGARPRLADAVAEAAGPAQEAGQGLVALVRAVLDGAREGLDRSVSKDPEDALRRVIDAVGDGLSRAALAGRLAVEEARGSCRQFAREDLARMGTDLKAVESLFAETVERGLCGCRSLTTTQVRNAVTHAGRVAERLTPVFATVLDAVRKHPVTLVGEGVQAGVSAGQGAAGALFQALGGLLKRAGDELRREGPKAAE
jgi:hypothetical protein